MITFIAFEFDNNTKYKLKQIQAVLKKYSNKGRWVDYNNFHITIKYLGKTDKNHFSKIEKIMYNIKETYKASNYIIENINHFKGNGSYRVVWLGLKGDKNKLVNINKTISKELCLLNYKVDNRKYKPHITLGRDVSFDISLEELNLKLKDLIRFEVKLNRIALMNSEIIENKRVYTKILGCKLD